MKKFTNYAQGTRGIRTETGVVYLDPGQSVEIDPKTIVGEVPDLGKKSDAPAEDGPDAGDFDALTAQVADLTKQVETLTKERDGLTKDKADLTKQVETLEGEKAELAKVGADLAKDKADLTKQVETLKKSAR